MSEDRAAANAREAMVALIDAGRAYFKANPQRELRARGRVLAAGEDSVVVVVATGGAADDIEQLLVEHGCRIETVRRV